MKNYRSDLWRITRKYLGVSIRAWTLYYLYRDPRLSLIESARVLKDALSGNHYKEINGSETVYNNCIEKAQNDVEAVINDDNNVKIEDDNNTTSSEVIEIAEED